jgi:hypothetical protein
VHLLDVVAGRCVDGRVPSHKGVCVNTIGTGNGIAVVSRLGRVPFSAARNDTSLCGSWSGDSSASGCTASLCRTDRRLDGRVCLARTIDRDARSGLQTLGSGALLNQRRKSHQNRRSFLACQGGLGRCTCCFLS